MGLFIGIGIGHANSVFRDVPGGITINQLPISASADIDGDGRVGHEDLLAVASSLGRSPSVLAREDVNHDGLVDVVDLAIVGRYLELGVGP